MGRSCVAWFPETETDRELVLSELKSILASQHFRNSKRYPLLLNHLVRETIDGNRDALKERSLGIEVFGRSPDYDTNADPIVRVTAGEIRKRLAQYYHEAPDTSDIQIELPVGSYAPEFKKPELLRSATYQTNNRSGLSVSSSPGETEYPPSFPATVTSSSGSSVRRLERILGAIVGLAIAISGAFAWAHLTAQSSPESLLWKPLLAHSNTVLLVLPSSRNSAESPDLQALPPGSKLPSGPYNRVSVSTAISLSKVASLMGSFGKSFDIREADSASLLDLHDRPAVLLGALDNHWTMKLTESLRFHVVEDPTDVRIVDSRNPGNRDWIVNSTAPYASAKRDYAIIARYHDASTGGEVLVLAGIGGHATQAAGTFVANPESLQQLQKMAPKGWEDKNIEMVIETQIINGEPAPAQLRAVETW